jgi:hypothetical protein
MVKRMIIRKHATRWHNLPDIAKTLSWRAVSKVLKLFEQTICVGRLGNQVHLMIQMLFLKKTMPPFTQLELFSHGLKSMKMNFNIFPGQHNRQI